MDLKEQESTLYELKKRYEIQEKEILHWRKLASQLEKEAHALDVVLARDLSEREGIEQELLERHGLSAENILTCQGALTVSMEEAIRETHQLKSALESAGAVNLAAIEEFQEAQMRFDHYDQQLKDLSDAKNDLEEIIAKLDQESRKTFKKTFQQIRANFQKNFELLFNGGTADLTFTESVDILEAGIEIVAKPPGKQLRAISLLSGGEKCLTALALLFSIFEVKPAPFCILDEVDAPLDDSNIDRFTRVLTQFIEKTQFLIVTHNKKTMSIADLLIGVSMEEKGVSKLISLAFEKKSQSQVTKC
jgi:chromosome segregation protein